MAAHREVKHLRQQNHQHDQKQQDKTNKAKKDRDDYLDGLKAQLKYNSEARASTLLHERKIPHFAPPTGTRR